MGSNIKSSLILKWTILSVIILTISACDKSNSKKFTQDWEAKIIKKCLERLYQSSSKEKYLVSPRYDNFDFNSFFKENRVLESYSKGYDYNQKKEQILHLLKWKDNDFAENQQMINKKYLNKNNPMILKFSNSKASQTVYYFSGIHENLVFATVVSYCDSIKISDLNLPTFNKNQKFLAADTVIFLLKGGEIQNMIVDSGIALDFQCP